MYNSIKLQLVAMEDTDWRDAIAALKFLLASSSPTPPYVVRR